MARKIALVPQPQRLVFLEGCFTLTPQTAIFVPDHPSAVSAARRLAATLRPATGFPLPVEEAGTPDRTAGIAFVQTGEDEVGGAEGYTLSVQPRGVVLRAASGSGFVYAAQTLLQLLPPEIESGSGVAAAAWEAPAVFIEDAPRFPIRGLLLDSSRHLQSVDYIKRTLDRMARYKLNTFHWHITDDQGWRLEIRKYPLLTETGAWRGGKEDRYGGFYTQHEIREVVAYAADRGITVVPEVDMPGHAVSALAAYPEYGCTGGPYRVRTEWGIEDDTICPGYEGSRSFVEDVLREVMELFPSPIIHIGGDEAPRARWVECPRCQKRITDGGLAGEDALQNDFTCHVADYLRANGRRLQGWNEIMDGGELPKDAIIHAWIHEGTVQRAVRAGHNVLDSMTTWLYFDYPYTVTPMMKTYLHDPVPDDLSPTEARRILGLQANLWTEYRPTEDSDDEFIWPRLLTVAERGWSSANTRDWADFRDRVRTDHARRLALMGAGDEDALANRLNIEAEE